jgi:hypothetical protein
MMVFCQFDEEKMSENFFPEWRKSTPGGVAQWHRILLESIRGVKFFRT